MEIEHSKKQLETHIGNVEAQSIIAERRIQHMLGIYKRNDALRIHKRQGETKFHHSILSFHKDDHVSREQLLKIYKEFVKQRYPKSIVCAVSHHDKSHQHIHCIGRPRTVWDRRYELSYETTVFRYQDTHGNGNSGHGIGTFQGAARKKKDKILVKDAEYQLQLKGQQSEKQQLKLLLAEVYSKAKSKQHFFKLLQKEGVALYFRGNSPGIIGRRKYRLKMLGYSQDRIAALDLEQIQKQQTVEPSITVKTQRKTTQQKQRFRTRTLKY